MAPEDVKEPSLEDCNRNSKVFDSEDQVGFACWYPQMGGYSAKAVAFFTKPWGGYEDESEYSGCVDVFIWHDGEFPFTGEDSQSSVRAPVALHHCDIRDFVVFGEKLSRLGKKIRP